MLDKPPGWLSIAGRDRESPVLVDWLEKSKDSPLFRKKVFVVHRLDRDTSGVILFARNPAAHRRASMAFENRETKKLYECLASGNPPLPIFRVNDPIEGAPSQSQVEVLSRGEQGFHARVRIFTGRRHQIRIHLANRGFPIWGDTRYGGAPEVLGVALTRMALHARRLEVPGVGAFDAELPSDMQGWMRLVSETADRGQVR